MLDQKAARTSPSATPRRGRHAASPGDPAAAGGSPVVPQAGTLVDVAGAPPVPGRLPFGTPLEGASFATVDAVPIPIDRALRRLPAEPPGRVGRALKRAIDLAGASAALLVLGPSLLATAGVIAAIDGRPVLFRQPRAGLRERPFEIFKFRTMRAGADAQRDALRTRNEVTGGASFKMTNDPRVTRLGRFLRRTSIDELPQLLNVVRGEMSLVGPRPHPFDDLAGYQPWHHGRFAMKPGITGLWQVSSRRDPDFDRWVELDLQYIRTWSPWLDLRIMFRTIPAMVRGEGR